MTSRQDIPDRTLLKKIRRKVLTTLHGLGNPSHSATKPLINSSFARHQMNIDIANWCRSCTGCQTAEVSHHNRPVFGKFEDIDFCVTQLQHRHRYLMYQHQTFKDNLATVHSLGELTDLLHRPTFSADWSLNPAHAGWGKFQAIWQLVAGIPRYLICGALSMRR